MKFFRKLALAALLTALLTGTCLARETFHGAYLQGFPDGSIRPDAAVTRAELAEILYRMMDLDQRRELSETESVFADVPTRHWAYDAITEAVAAGYFKGVSDTAFDPEGTLTRAMLVTVLARAAGAETDDNASTGFSDVAVGTWYTGAVAWAAENGVVTGDGDGTFAPDRAATRQETATIFLRLLKLLNKTLPEIEEVKTFTDAADIAAWAEEAVETMQTAGVLTGYPDGSFKPEKGVTRAEAAAILARLKAQLALREKGCEYVCTVGDYWLMQYPASGSVGLALYEPLTGKLVQTVGLWKAAQGVNGYVAFDRLLSGSDGIYGDARVSISAAAIRSSRSWPSLCWISAGTETIRSII